MEVNKVRTIENYLNRYQIDKHVFCGSLVGLPLNLTPKRVSFFFIVKILFRCFSPFTFKKNVYSFVNGKFKGGEKNVFLSLTSFNYRVFNLIKGLIEKNNFRIFLTSSQKRFGDGYPKYYKKLVFPWKIALYAFIKSASIPDVDWKGKLITFYWLNLQIHNYYFAKDILKVYTPHVVLTDFDRYSNNVTFVLAGKNLGIPTVTLVHGATYYSDPFFVPVIADHMFGWGQYHKDLFMKDFKQEVLFHIVGNPKVSKFETFRKFPEKFSQVKIGWGTTNTSQILRERLVNIFVAGTRKFGERFVKIHPQESVDLYKMFENESHFNILKSDFNNNDFFQKIDVFCVRRSTIGSEALAYNIPVIVIDGDQGRDIQNGGILNKYAGCPIVNSSKELEYEIKLLVEDRNYLEKRLLKQKKYFEYLYEFQGEDSNEKMIKKLQTLSEQI